MSEMFQDDGNTSKEAKGHSVLPGFLEKPCWFKDLSCVSSPNKDPVFGLMDLHSGYMLCRTEAEYEQLMREKYMMAVAHDCQYCPFLQCERDYCDEWSSYCHLFHCDLDSLAYIDDFADCCMTRGYAFGELSFRAGHKNNRYRRRRNRKDIRRALKGVYGKHKQLKKFERRTSRLYYLRYPDNLHQAAVERAFRASLKQAVEHLVQLYRRKNKLTKPKET